MYIEQNRRCISLSTALLLVICWASLSGPMCFAAEQMREYGRSVDSVIRADANVRSANDRHNRLRELLAKESTQESLFRLWEGELYLLTAAAFMEEPQPEIPVPRSVGKYDLVSIMGNRRFLKVIGDLSELNKEKASELLTKEIESSLEVYQSLFDEYIDSHKEYFARALAGEQGLGLGFELAHQNRPTLVSMRFKMLALILTAGNLRLTGTQAAVDKVLNVAVSQREMFYQEGAFCKFHAGSLLIHASIYSPQILATGVLGTYVEPAEREKILGETVVKMEREKLGRFDAKRIPHSLSSIGEDKPFDYSKGQIIVEYIEPIDDATFDAIVKAAAKAI